MTKKVLSLLLALTMILSMTSISAFASESQGIIVIGDLDPATPPTTGIGFPTNDEDDDPDALLTCDCVVECTEDAINADCPVCATQPELCVVGVNVGVENIMPVTASPGTTFAGGSGTQQDPWQINTRTMLEYLATEVNLNNSTYNNKHYKLTANIDLSSSSWTPIGNASGSFNGTFDGNGKTISGLAMSGAVTSAGLFGDINNGAAVKNLGVTGVNINVTTGSFCNIGGLVGQLLDGSVTNCHVTGSVSVTHAGFSATTNVGGLVGSASNNTSVTACYSTVSVSVANNGSSAGAYVGGLVGLNNGSVTNCYATGNVTTTTTQSSGISSATGGLAGRNSGAAATIKNSYATGNVTGINLTGTHTTGGLVGGNEGGTPAIKNCYAAGNVTGNSNGTGGLVGYQNSGSGGGITSSYWNSTATQTAGGSAQTPTKGVGTNNTGDTDATGMTAANMKATAFLTTLNNWVATKNAAVPPPSPLYLNWQAVTGGFPTLPLAPIVDGPPDTDTDTQTTTSSGGGSSSGGSSSKPAPPAPVITPMDDKASGVLSTAINAAATVTSGESLGVKLKNVSNFTKANAAAIIAKAKALGKKATVSSDVMSEDGTYVEVRVTVDPTLIKQNVRLDGYTRASQTFITQTRFTKHFENKTAIISLGQDGKFGQTAKISARLDFKGFDQSNLYLYSYDKKANKYTLITSKDYTIDRKGYLVFNTDLGGDIIVSNGKLVRK